MIYPLLFFIFVLCLFLGLEFFYKVPFKFHRLLLTALTLLPPVILILIWDASIKLEIQISSSLKFAGLLIATMAFVLGAKALVKEYQSLKGKDV